MGEVTKVKPRDLKYLCFDCPECYTISFTDNTVYAVFINDFTKKVYYHLGLGDDDMNCELYRSGYYKSDTEKTLCKEDVETFIKVGHIKFKELFDRGELKGNYK